MGGQLHFLAERVSSFEKERIVENSGKVKPRSRLLIANDSSQIMYKNTSEAWDGCRYEPSLPYLFTPLLLAHHLEGGGESLHLISTYAYSFD